MLERANSYKANACIAKVIIIAITEGKRKCRDQQIICWRALK